MIRQVKPSSRIEQDFSFRFRQSQLSGNRRVRPGRRTRCVAGCVRILGPASRLGAVREQQDAASMLDCYSVERVNE